MVCHIGKKLPETKYNLEFRLEKEEANKEDDKEENEILPTISNCSI